MLNCVYIIMNVYPMAMAILVAKIIPCGCV